MSRLYGRLLFEIVVSLKKENKLKQVSSLKYINELINRELSSIEIEEYFRTEGPGVHNYWITPAGERIKIDIGKHEKYACDWLLKNDKEWLERSFFTCNDLEELDPCKELEDRGWIRVLNWKVREFMFVTAPGRKTIPQCQKNAIADICIEAGIPFPVELG